jgi:hyperosmotically inducible protein
MKISLATTCFVIGTALAPIGAYAADAPKDSEHPVTSTSNAVITTKVKEKFAEDKTHGLQRVSVETNEKGAVSLSGYTKSQQEADNAVSIARATEGVTAVTSKIKVKAQ